MKENKDIAIQKFAAENILANTQILLQILAKIQTPHYESEDIHDLRVASRRIRTALSIFGDLFPKQKLKKWEGTIRSITRTFGERRDRDVQIEFLKNQLALVTDKKLRSGIARLYLRLVQKRKKEEAKLENQLSMLQKNQDILTMQDTMQQIIQTPAPEGYPAQLYQLAFQSIYTRLDQFLYYEVFLHHPENIHELHLMRIAAKHLRYALEIFLPLYNGQLDEYLTIMKAIQQKLGLIHDCDVWVIFIPKFAEAEKQRTRKYYGRSSPINRLMPGFLYIQENRKEEREKLYADFLQEWQMWKSTERWLKLRELVLQATISSTNHAQSNQTEAEDIPTANLSTR